MPPGRWWLSLGHPEQVSVSCVVVYLHWWIIAKIIKGLPSSQSPQRHFFYLVYVMGQGVRTWRCHGTCAHFWEAMSAGTWWKKGAGKVWSMIQRLLGAHVLVSLLSGCSCLYCVILSSVSGSVYVALRESHGCFCLYGAFSWLLRCFTASSALVYIRADVIHGVWLAVLEGGGLGCPSHLPACPACQNMWTSSWPCPTLVISCYTGTRNTCVLRGLFVQFHIPPFTLLNFGWFVCCYRHVQSYKVILLCVWFVLNLVREYV